MPRERMPLVPWSCLPDPITPTWGRNSEAQIINLMRAGKSNSEIAEITGNRLEIVKRVIRRHLNPDEFAPLPQPKRKIEWSKIACKNCGKEFEVEPWVAKHAKRKSCSMRFLWEGREKRGPA